jgi:hypothetical protein
MAAKAKPRRRPRSTVAASHARTPVSHTMNTLT